MQDYIDGELVPTFSSKGVLENANDTFVTVVGPHNYLDIVLDDEKDTLVNFCAPPCSHCKA